MNSYWSTFVMQKMNFINDEQSNELCVGSFARLSRHNVPLFRRCDNDLCVVDLRFGERLIARQLANFDAVRLETIAKVLHHFLHKRLHRRNIHHLEVGQLKHTGVVTMHGQFVHDSQHSNICFAYNHNV